MKVLVFSISVGSLLMANLALAACPSGSETLFFCNTQKGNKQLEVCDAGKTISYSFGKKGQKPELAIAVPRSKASTWQWQGIGRYMSYSVNIPNSDYNYNVFWSVDRVTEEHAIEAGVNVEKKGKLLTTLLCQEKGLINNLEGVDLKPAE
ncbi:hypothetical protein SAMN02745130_00098 [Thiothrix eikelboomii]|uniref:Uncharacterized protein n=1 Tax=Thiothrix eikelboomii TaxID=92487 RepID=A0A1T4VRZ4_9GAMM|nr:hypothetical protein [Thiothrix eikelboomii]SKA67717.1 hypothetical protein SAMN02745130_00098 [Thiothrix eikelboomii]